MKNTIKLAVQTSWRERIDYHRLAQYALLIVFLFLASFVLLMTISLSLRPRIAITADFWALPVPPIWDNYRWAFRFLQAPMIRTLTIVGTSVIGILVFALPASYAFARIHFPGRKVIFLMFIAVMMVPAPILLTPNFILANQWGLKGTVQGLILFYIGGGQAFAVFLITTFFVGQEKEVFEAARVDGASEFQSMLRIALPMAWPIIMTVAILNFLTLYSDLIWPALMLPTRYHTVMIALNQVGPVSGAASYLVASIPQLILFVVAMRYFVQGLSTGAVKA